MIHCLNQTDLISISDLRGEYSAFALEVIFVEGFLAAKAGFVLNLAVGTIYRL